MILSDLEVAHGNVTANGAAYHYVERGTGPLVLLLHGFPECWWGFRYQIAPLADAGFRVVAADLRGFGGSAKYGPYDLDTYAADVTALIRALGASRAHVIGHGFGGAIAWHLAALKPAYVDRVGVINCPHPARLFESMRRPRVLARSAWAGLYQLPVLPEWLLSREVYRLYALHAKNRENFSPEELLPMLENARQPGAAAGMLGHYRAFFARAVKSVLAPPHYPAIDAEALLIWGKRDLGFRFDDVVPGTEKYAQHLTVREVPEAGHFALAEAPFAVNEALLAFFQAPRDDARDDARAVAHAAELRVVLQSIAEGTKISVIKELRSLTGMDLRDAKEMVESLPSTVFDRTPRENAHRARELLTAAGATVELQWPRGADGRPL